MGGGGSGTRSTSDDLNIVTNNPGVAGVRGAAAGTVLGDGLSTILYMSDIHHSLTNSPGHMSRLGHRSVTASLHWGGGTLRRRGLGRKTLYDRCRYMMGNHRLGYMSDYRSRHVVRGSVGSCVLPGEAWLGLPLTVTTCVLDRLSFNPLRNSSLHQGSAGIHYLGAAVFGGRYLNTGCGDFLLTCLSNYCILMFVYHSLTNLLWCLYSSWNTFLDWSHSALRL